MTSVSPAVAKPLTSTAYRLGDTAVLTLRGTLDPASPARSGVSVESALTDVEDALNPRPRVLVADLAGVEPSHFVVGLLGLLRRRATRVGVPFVLAGVSPPALEALHRAHVAPLYALYPSLGSALADPRGVHAGG